jgi:uncharacterized membrane protein
VKSLIVMFSLGIVLISMTAGYSGYQFKQIEQSNQWTGSVNSGKSSDDPKIFTAIGGIQKILDDHNIGINLLGGRYELSYKRIY